MNDPLSKVLLITADQAKAALIQQVVAKDGNGRLDIEWTSELSAGLGRLSTDNIHAVVLELPLADYEGIEVIDKLLLTAPHIPALILGRPQDQDFAQQIVQRGAVDYLLSDEVNSHILPQTLRNAIARQTAENALFIEQDRVQVTLNSISDAVLGTDMSGDVTHINLAGEILTGWSREEALRRPLSEVFRIIDCNSRAVVLTPLGPAIGENKTLGLPVDHLLIRRDGVECAIEYTAAPIHDRSGQAAGAVIVFRDMSESQSMKQKMSHLALHDPLTDLPNRTLLHDRISQAIGVTGRHGSQFAVMYLDVDRFKLVNDSLGHSYGDRLLQSIANRLSACVRSSDTVSRVGGDEFVVLLMDMAQVADAALVANKMLASLAAPYRIASHDVFATVSIGISVCPDHGIDAETLLHNADIALYHAKDQGRNNSQFFKHDMAVRAVEQRSVEAGLRGALRRGELSLQYQPIVRLATGKITGAEALLRWHHPDLGTFSPGQFVPIAEECELIVPIGQWVLREACRQAQAWRERGLAIDHIAVNISAIEFQTKGFLDSVRAILRDTGLEPRFLELELTESVLMRDAETTTTLLDELKTIGVRLAIDDFGTGYSSLSYLSRFPIDTLKIDQSFVRKMISESDSATIVSTVINMGKSLKKRVIAEGVETPEQLAYLQALHCEDGQGFHFSKPMYADEFATVVGLHWRAPDSARTRTRGGNDSWAVTQEHS